ncbi:hypothetical protein [Profundibacterium mesophilum]|uniref:Mobilization protein C n=1 Tax=Profundibacterium mesophilum KAUST100406-0324 TaxID=1037889 RepID=A0A921NPR0_9RHOB|nr:hypothetical protein [Profundibacterium mesophilum]KAF0676281.1 Mobilization protein C [Profundibacterium mesophilum KAUST100406-0324]
MSKIDDRIAKIEKEMEQRRARLKDLKAEATKQERKDDVRRKVLYGAAYLAGLETLSEDARRRSLARVEAHITRPKDRVFLGLPALDKKNEAPRKPEDRSGETPGLPFGNS